MRELTYEEMEQIDGGLAPFMLGLAVVSGAAAGYATGGWKGAILGATFAAPTAIFAGVAGATYGVTRLVFSAYSVGTGTIGAVATGSVDKGTGS